LLGRCAALGRAEVCGHNHALLMRGLLRRDKIEVPAEVTGVDGDTLGVRSFGKANMWPVMWGNVKDYDA
jgi:hypothetical protein